MNFDIDRYLTTVAPLDDTDIDYGTFSEHPLDEATLRCLRYMHDVEHHTVCYLRDLLVTQAHDDPEITSFLTMWAYEEFWHGEAIGKVLTAHGETAGRQRVRTVRDRVSNRLGAVPTMIASLLTKHLVTVSLTWGAVNEWTTQAGYLRLAKLADHPTLTALVQRIAKQEGRHIDFYMTEATRRLRQSTRAQRVTHWALTRRWAPVGSSIMPAAETNHLITHLFRDADGEAMAARIDRRIQRLPGLGDLDLVTQARREHLALAA